MKILFVATVPEHFFYFHTACFEMLRERGFEVHAASSGTRGSEGRELAGCELAGCELAGCERHFTVPIVRSPFALRNVGAYRTLKRLIAENGYDVIHCHTPMGGVMGRLAARRARKNGAKVIYTAHGFHFYKGAPLLNWLLYFPIEYAMSFLTDELLTINPEDRVRAEKRLKAKRVRYIHGVGYDTARFRAADGETRRRLREKYGYPPDAKLIIYVAELNKNKNQAMLIRAAEKLREQSVNARLLLVGPDSIGGEYQRMAGESGAAVDFLGVRGDVPELLSMCDVYAASSLREGLPVNVMEAMASGLPVVAADNRGHRALIANGETGFLVRPNDADAMAGRIASLLNDRDLYERISENAALAIEPFGRENVLHELAEIYFEG
ncbi:MAG: glycosyltransferase family 4 protein [Oscillospiraceae bacterium]|nr:glycosyltransferase family 4 protein [Oscillospiraceae bacterium]